MYTIIGGDGREYGPVSPEQIRQWIAAGRANGETRAKAFGTEEWKHLGDFPEFNPAARSSPESLAAMPQAFGSAAVAAPISANFDPIECFSRSWDLLRRNFWPFVGLAVVMCFFWLLPSLIVRSAFPAYQVDPAHPLAYFKTGPFYAGICVNILFTGPLYAGALYYFLRKARGEAGQFSDLFAGFTRAYGSLVLAIMVCGALEFLGFVCLILPGIYLVVAYGLAQITIIDRRCGFWTGMELSRQAVTKRWWAFLLLLILSVIVLVVGVIALGVGVLVALPLCLGAMAYAYLDLVPGGGAPDQVVQGDLPRPEGE